MMESISNSIRISQTVTADEKQAATWRDALDYPSTYQTGYMRSFLEDGKWWELIPRFDDEG
ncbi:MAG: hypothetical protein IJK02_00005, partial [Clostridia bacterium]|nr:hypothetical protein [Clostridia bacterium]